MKKAAFFVITAVLLAISLPVLAQEFPDVPPDHWAYDAVQDLVDKGIIQGYPDGLFGGKRAMTRYEFAEAVSKAIPAIIELAQAGGPGVVGPQGPPGPPGAPGAGAEEIQAMRKLVDEFRDELSALGVDVEALRRDVAALNDRVTALEEEVARVRFTGEVNLIGRGEVRNTAHSVGDRDSRLLSVGAAPGEENNPLANSSFFTDLQLGMKAKVGEDASVNALVAAGNYLKWALVDDKLPDLVLWNLYMDGDAKFGPLGAAHVRVGRFPFQLTPLTLKFVDPDSYTSVTKLDSGDYVLDGGSASFSLGKAALTAFAAKAHPIADLITPALLLGSDDDGVPLSQLAGARLVIGTGSVGNLGLTYLQAGVGGGRSEIIGADITTNIGSLGVAAEYAESRANLPLQISKGIGGEDDAAWNGKLSYQMGKLGLGAGYSHVESYYHAPGYWNRLGSIVNPVNLKGATANLTYALTPRISFSAEGQFLSPIDDQLDVAGRTSTSRGRVLAGTDIDKINYWRAGISYGLTSANTVDLGWEETNIEPNASDSSKERFISLGVGHSFNPNASLKLLYQIVEYEQGDDSLRGGVATAQFQLKY
ncbi:MAG TPA: porin [Armatimonadota bacterium]|nr:porin [Armatimonadota bacterium]